jgi:hypothetical protein
VAAGAISMLRRLVAQLAQEIAVERDGPVPALGDPHRDREHALGPWLHGRVVVRVDGVARLRATRPADDETIEQHFAGLRRGGQVADKVRDLARLRRRRPLALADVEK